MTTVEMQNILMELMRTIDKKTIVTIETRPDPDRPGVTVHLACGKRTGTLEVTEADLVAGQTDLMRKHRVRTALKRARDRMWDETGYFFSTKNERQMPEGGGHFFRQQQGRGRR